MPYKSATVWALLLVSTWALFPATALGQRQDLQMCYEGSTPDKVINTCSVVIGNRTGDEHDLAAALKNRGDAYDDKHQHQLAIKDYTDAIALDPQDAQLFNNHGTWWIAVRQYERAIKDFDHAIELKPGFIMALTSRCFAKANLDRFGEAMTDCNEALRLKPQSPDALASRSFVYLKLRRADEAIRDYDAVLALRNDPYAFFGRGVAKLMKGDRRGSDDDIVQAEEIKPDIAEHMATLGVELRLIR